MAKAGWWKPRHGEEIRIRDLNNGHLENAIKYMDDVLVRHVPNINSGKHAGELILKIGELRKEAARRGLAIKYGTPVADPDDFVSQPYLTHDQEMQAPPQPKPSRARRSISS